MFKIQMRHCKWEQGESHHENQRVMLLQYLLLRRKMDPLQWLKCPVKY